MRTNFFCTIVLVILCEIMTVIAESCGSWIAVDDATTYKNLVQGLAERAQIPIKEYEKAPNPYRCMEELIRRNFEKSGDLLIESFHTTGRVNWRK